MKRFYLSNPHRNVSAQRFDVDDRIIEHARIAKSRVLEDWNDLGWRTVIDISPLANSAISEYREGQILNDPLDSQESDYMVQVGLDFLDDARATAQLGYYMEDGEFGGLYDFDGIRDITEADEAHFGYWFLRQVDRGATEIQALLVPEDRELFQRRLEQFREERKREVEGSPRKEI